MVEIESNKGLNPIQKQTQIWGPSVDGKEIRSLQGRYEASVGENEWDEIVQTAAFILGRCPSPDEASRRVTGLALGKVQSGKTLSYTSLIGLAIDNGYRITVVLAGTKKALLTQTYTRLCQDLEAGGQSATPFENPRPQDAEVIQSVLYGQGHVLIVVLKNRQRLEDVKRVLVSPEIRSVPTLIIDDEGDEASLNTQFRRKKFSKVYKCIVNLREVLPLHAYVAYTATPQANLLISGIDGLSPDFGVLVEPGQGYCGGSKFFGTESNNFVRQIPLSEAENEYVTKITDSLRRALSIFFVGSAIRHLRDPRANHSMLVHTSNLREDHQSLLDSVQFLMTLWKERLNIPSSDPASQVVLDLMRLAYDDLRTTVSDPPAWQDVSSKLRDEMWLTEVWMVNSLPLGRDPIGTPFRLKNNILIGGNMLGRGVTIDGLAVTYITRRASRETNADTMEQRARWFGYKEEYLDLCRIFVTPQLRKDYTELLRHEEDFWDSLRRNSRQNIPIRDWPRILSLDSSMGLSPTRSSVASFRQFRGSGWQIQNRLVEDATVASRNIQVARKFFGINGGEIRSFGNVHHRIISGCLTETVIKDILSQVDTEGTNWDVAYTREYLARLLFEGVLPCLDVVFMSNGEKRVRTKGRNGSVNPMQGRSPGRATTDPKYYPGDDNIHNGRVQLQVHVIQLQGNDIIQPIETSAFALYVPDFGRYDLSLIVRR